MGAETRVIFVCIVGVSKLDQIFFHDSPKIVFGSFFFYSKNWGKTFKSNSLNNCYIKNVFAQFVSTISIFFLNVRNNMEEAIARNIVLKILHDRIPSYAIWDSNDIENESIDFRIKWWSELVSHQNITIVNMAKQWVAFLNTIRNQRFYK